MSLVENCVTFVVVVVESTMSIMLQRGHISFLCSTSLHHHHHHPMMNQTVDELGEITMLFSTALGVRPSSGLSLSTGLREQYCVGKKPPKVNLRVQRGYGRPNSWTCQGFSRDNF